MKKFILSVMVTIITFITVFAIFSFKTQYIIYNTQSATSMDKDEDTAEGAGYIFDDFDKNINIKN